MILRYLGVAGWHLATPDAELLIDPYFSRLSAVRVLAGYAVPDRRVIVAYTPPTARWILVTHAHYDHLMDVPVVAQITGATVYAPQEGCDLLAIPGVPAEQCRSIHHGDRLLLDGFAVEVYRTPHRVIFGRVPYEGPLRPGLRPPLRARDYRIREQFSFRIHAEGIRILVASGIDDEPAVEADVLLVGADASREQLARIIGPARPRLIMPNHWDDMFRPLTRPIRPMLRPTRGLAFPRRIDLDGWVRIVRDLAPQAQVIVPEHFAPYSLAVLELRSRTGENIPCQPL